MQRLLAVTFYFGLAPWLWRFCLRGEKRFLKHHFSQALVVTAIFFLILILFIVVEAVGVYEMIRHPDFAESGGLDSVSATQGILFLLLGSVWLLAWIGGIVLAAMGSTRALPVVGRLAGRKAFIGVSFVVCSPAYLVLLVLGGVTLHATSLTDRQVRPAPVYMLYDDLGYVPGWVFDLGFYRVSRAAKARWGRGSVVVAPVSEASLETAFESGRFVFVATHGLYGNIITEDLEYGPEDAGEVAIGGNLQFVYIAACYGGEQVRKWQAALEPAKVVAFDRESYVVEHIRYLWSEAPQRLSEVR